MMRLLRVWVDKPDPATGFRVPVHQHHQILLQMMRYPFQRMTEEPGGLFAFGKVAALHPRRASVRGSFHVEERAFTDIKVHIRQHTVRGVLRKVNVGNGRQRDFHLEMTPSIFNLPFKAIGLEGAEKIGAAKLETMPGSNGQSGAVQKDVIASGSGGGC